MIMIVWIIIIGFIVLKLATSAYNPPKNRKTSTTIPIPAAAVIRIPVGVSGGAVRVPIAIAGAEEEAIVPEGETGEAAVAIEAHRALFFNVCGLLQENQRAHDVIPLL
ncbi:hypothetical protein [Paenibacillus chitinolyticus]|uniref:hypothetical protein n=1 Tax=Paenibacillus chitinolyticus TaxID=79263 RepID=UPI003650B777